MLVDMRSQRCRFHGVAGPKVPTHDDTIIPTLSIEWNKLHTYFVGLQVCAGSESSLVYDINLMFLKSSRSISPRVQLHRTHELRSSGLPIFTTTA